jgi:hypothetical protein
MFLNSTPDESFFKALIYGRPGAGKSTLAVTADDPLVILSERQGYRSVKDAARRLRKPLPPTILVQTLEDVRAVLLGLQSDPEQPIASAMRKLGASDADVAALPYQKPKTVVIDSITEVFELISRDIERIAGRKVGKDGLEVKPERYWGVLRDRSERLIRAFRDLPYHILFLALLSDREIGDGDEKSRVIDPSCPMKALPASLAAAVNAVGIISVAAVPTKSEDGHTVYEHKRWVRFAAPDWMMTKALRPLRDVEVPDVGAWLRRLAQEEADESPLALEGIPASGQGDEVAPIEATPVENALPPQQPSGRRRRGANGQTIQQSKATSPGSQTEEVTRE